MKIRTGTVATCLAVAAVLTPLAMPAGAAPAPRELPLGPRSLEETRTAREVAPGVTHIAIERGEASADDFWTVNIGVGTTEAEAADLERLVRDAGYEPRRDPTAGEALGCMVRVGAFTTRDEAQATRDRIAARGLPAGVQFTGEDGHDTTGPWSLDVLVIDPEEFEGSFGAELATGIVPGRETTSSIAERTGALAAVNGGFFVIGGTRTTPGPWLAGTDGDPAGISVVDGELISEAVNGRPALVVPDDSGEGTAVRRLSTRLSVRSSDRATAEVTGLNRQSGLIVNCGGVGDATPFARPAHDYTCGNDNELIAITPEFGPSAPEGTGYQVTLDRNGRVTAVQDSRGGSVPANGTVLQGTGTGADWLRAHAGHGDLLTVREETRDADTGKRIRLTDDTSIVNGGPLLLRDGRIALDPARDGFSPQDIGTADRAGFYNGWYLRRNPRTAAGVTDDGRIILLTADGRNPGHSVGLTIPETAEVMRSLGAVDAINLDGGGSTAMVVDDELQTTPSDATGERPDADALVVLP